MNSVAIAVGHVQREDVQVDEGGFVTHFSAQDREFADHQRWVCQSCGVHSRPSKQIPSAYMEVVPYKGELTLLCAYCAHAVNLVRPMALGLERKGKLYRIAEDVSQADINRILIARYMGIVASDGMDCRSNFIGGFLNIVDHLDTNFSFLNSPALNMSNVSDFVATMAGMSDHDTERCSVLFKNAVFIPDLMPESKFQNPANYYFYAMYEKLIAQALTAKAEAVS